MTTTTIALLLVAPILILSLETHELGGVLEHVLIVAFGWFMANNHYGFGSLVSLIRNHLETSKDLSSMSNLHSQSSDLCCSRYFNVFHFIS